MMHAMQTDFIFCFYFLQTLYVCDVITRMYLAQQDFLLSVYYAAKLDTWYVSYCQQLLAGQCQKELRECFEEA